MSQATATPDPGTPLIFMRAITKVFYTDEIETHALSGVHCDIRRGEFVSISGPVGMRQVDAARDPRACSIPPSSGEYR